MGFDNGTRLLHVLLDRIPPHHVTLARQVQAVVGVTLVQPPLVVGQRPPDIEVGDFLLVAQRFEPLNKRLEALCDEKEVTYLDVWGALADHEGRLDKRYTNDGLHLTGEGYVVWRDAIKQHVK